MKRSANITMATFGFLPMVPLVILPLVPLEPLATIEPWIVSAANYANGTIGRATGAYGTIGKNVDTIGKNERCTRQLTR